MIFNNLKSIFSNKYSLIAILFCLAGQLSAQQELMMQTLPNIWQANSVNPAFFPKDKHVVIGLPSYLLDGAHSGKISYSDLIRKEGDQTIIDFGNVIDKLEDENEVFLDQRIETLSLGLRLGGWSVSAGHANRLNTSIIYPKQLAQLLWNGNGAYIGQTLEIAPRATVSDWNEWSVGLARHFKKVSVSARVKYLNGVSSFASDENHHSASVYTDDDIYQLTLNTDYGFHSSSLISAIDTSGLGFNIDIADVKNKLFTSNRGFSYDFGLYFQPTEKLAISASVLDMGGKIKWKESANYYISRGTYQYDGVVFAGSDIINGTDSLSFDQKLDTLNDIFKFNKSAESFTTELPQRLFAGATYQLTKRVQVGVSAFAQNTNNRRRSGFGLSARWQPVKWVSLGAMYSVNTRSAANLGFHVMLKPGPVQVFFASDHLIGALTPKGAPAVNLRLGGSLIF